MDNKTTKSVAGMIKAIIKKNPRLTLDDAIEVVKRMRKDIIKIEVEPLDDTQYVVRTTRKVS